MGPTIVFDKSFLHSLNPDESVWLEMFFSTNITPLFYIETLADLEKEVLKGRTPEDVVGNLAIKTPEMNAWPNVHHNTILDAELLHGEKINMKDGKTLVSGGTSIELDGEKGIVFERSPEEEALNRWRRHEFLDLERQEAKKWRRELSLVSPEQYRAAFSPCFDDHKPRDLLELKETVDYIIDEGDRKRTLENGLTLLGALPDCQTKIVQRWESNGAPAIAEFAPYFRFVYGIKLLFYLAFSSEMISQRPTNEIDITYLYYLPFCMVFASSDKVHKQTVPLFKRADQSFEWGYDLKADFGRLDKHYSALPDEVKERGLLHFASRPPHDNSFLVTQLWDRHMHPDWREQDSFIDGDIGNIPDTKIVAKINKAEELAQSGTHSPDGDSDQRDFMITKACVSKRKGKWKLFSPEVEDAANDSNS